LLGGLGYGLVGAIIAERPRHLYYYPGLAGHPVSIAEAVAIDARRLLPLVGGSV
jgi:hypothetical protein